ncbi:MAG: sugar ABC transporter substrate-binding protein [Syntrophales bacterium]|nr:sugar ABC transporter substrate-binding protein [Syntrophales bacterium]
MKKNSSLKDNLNIRTSMIEIVMKGSHNRVQPLYAICFVPIPANGFLRGLFLLVAIALVLLAVPVEAREFHIGVLYWSMNIPGQVAMRKGLEGEAKNINKAALKNGGPKVKLEIRVAGDGEAGIKNQIRQMHELIAMHADLIIVQPTDNAALAAPLREANRARIPVVAYDQYINGGVLSAYRTSDNYQAGYLDGEYVSSRFPNEKEIRLVLVEYPHVSSTVERVNGFLDALKEAGRRYRVLKSYSAVEPVSGKKAANDILRDFPKIGSIDVIFTVNDGGGLSVVNGLSHAGRNEIMVATIDGDPASIKNIRAGRLTVIDSAQFCGPLGAEAMKAAYALLTGSTPPFHALVPVFPVTRETLDRYPGWQGPIPAPFKKPWKCKQPQWQRNLSIVKP